jgi:hypothetical protein
MANNNDFDLSELERELDLDSSPLSVDETSADEEIEPDPENEALLEAEEQFDSEADFESDDPMESFEDSVHEQAASYGDRFYELSERSFEGPVDSPLNEILDEMSREYFLGGLVKRLKKGVPGLKNLVRKGMRLAQKAGVDLPVLGSLKNVTGLAQNLLQGNLAGVAKNAMGAALKAYPGTAAAAPILGALGFESGEPEQNREAWQNFAEVARESYEYLADNFNETSVQPDKAIELAQKALQHGLRQADKRGQSHPGRSRKTRVLRLAPGERVLVICDRHGE